MSYEDLLAEADEAGLTVKEKPLHAHDGRIAGKNIAIRQDIPTLAQKACVLAEELGHYHTASGDILDQSSDANRKQEFAGRLWAYDRQIGLSGIIQGYRARCRNRYLAEVPELPGCMADGESLAEVATAIEESMKLWIEVNRERGIPIPEPKGRLMYA